MTKPNFMDVAREWLVRAQGHSRPELEKSLADELRRLWELGVANAIEVVHAAEHRDPVHGYIDQDETIDAIRAIVARQN